MSALALKLFAVLTMLTDHIGAVLYADAFYGGNALAAQSLLWMRAVGRVAFPIFAFLVAEGCAHTQNMKKYIARLAAFAILSEIPFDLFSALQTRAKPGALVSFGTQNVMFTLALGALAVCLYNLAWADKPRAVLWGAAAFGAVAATCALKSEFAPFGAAAIVAAYALRPKEQNAPDARVFGRRSAQIAACWLVCAAYSMFTRWHPLYLGLLAVPFVLVLYDGRPGARRSKYAFYIFYPAHLAALACALYLIMNGYIDLIA